MGVDSGLPDFRGPEGFWRAYPPYRSLGLRFEQLADPVHFANDPSLAWGFYGHRLQLYRDTVPHKGFAVLRRWADRYPSRVFTSNVDGQFRRAGFSDGSVAECHGSIHHLQCLAGCGAPVWSAEGVTIDIDEATMRAVGDLPSCPSCGSPARPNILMFGDWNWDDARSGAQLDAHTSWLQDRTPGSVGVVELGAGLGVPTVRNHAERVARALGTLIRINVREPQVPRNLDVGIAAGAAETLTAIDLLLKT